MVPESGCLNTEGGVLGMEFSLLVLGSVAIYLCCGVVYNLRLKGRPPAGTSFVSFLGPHREFCEACLPLAPPYTPMLGANRLCVCPGCTD